MQRRQLLLGVHVTARVHAFQLRGLLAVASALCVLAACSKDGDPEQPGMTMEGAGMTPPLAGTGGGTPPAGGAGGAALPPEGGTGMSGASGGGGVGGMPPASDAGTQPPQSPMAIDPGAASPEWHAYGHDYSNTRANTAESVINAGNVAQLVEKWTHEGGAVTGTPSLRDGSVYFADWQGAVTALDAKTGSVVWNSAGLGIMMTPSAQVSDDALFVGGEGGYLYRVDRATGEKQWEMKTDEAANLRLWGSPARVDDLVINGVASYQVFIAGSPPFRGNVVALDATTGEQRWKVYLTENTGVSVWSSPAIDTGLKLMFIGTGQQYSGDTPYSDALVAIDYEAGELRWGAQFTAHDSWTLNVRNGPDHDVGASPNLFEAGGRALVGVGDKGGRYFALDRATGEMVWMRELTPGSPNGGVVGSTAYHDGLIYIVSNDGSSGQGGFGTSGPSASSAFALDAATGDVIWEVPVVSACFGAVSWAGGVVFFGTIDGVLHALDAGTGNELWHVAAKGSVASGVSISDGMIYVGWGWDWLNKTTGGVTAYGLP